MTRLLLLALVALVSAAPHAQTTLGVFVGNQGPPASLTFLDRPAGTAQQLTAIPLSGFLQGMELMNGRLYVTGNGDRIDVVDPATRERVGQITDAAFTSARYFVQVSPTKAYVTTQNYATGATTSTVVVLDLTTNTVAGRITVPVPFPEVPALAGDRVYVAAGAFSGDTRLVVIDLATDAVLAPVEIGCEARFVFGDDDGEVHAVCTDTGEVVVLDGTAGTVTVRVATGSQLGSNQGIGQDGALVRLSTGTEQFLVLATSTGPRLVGSDTRTVGPPVPIADVATRPVSAIGFDPERFQYLLGRPDPTAPFSAAGTVTVHNLTGALVASYPAGVFPSHITVRRLATTAGEVGPEASGLRLGAPAPNPTAGPAEVLFALGAPADVTVTVVDALGREVARLASGPFGAGEHTVAADLRGLPAGVYTVRLAAGASVATRRLTVVR